MGRHPLQEQVVDSFVPNDAHIVGGTPGEEKDDTSYPQDYEPEDAEVRPNVLILTGANACGKVYDPRTSLIWHSVDFS